MPNSKYQRIPIQPWIDQIESEYKVEDCIIDVNGTENLVRVVIPTPVSGRETQAFPLMVWFHGGGMQEDCNYSCLIAMAHSIRSHRICFRICQCR